MKMKNQMIKPINKDKAKIKNLMGLVDNPTYEDLLFEIVYFLEREGNEEGIFKKYDASVKTRCRIESELIKDLDTLCELGYLEKLKYTKYKLIKHLWE